MKEFLLRANAMMETLVADRRHLHANPEVGDELPKTVAYVKKRLEAMGYEPQDLAKSGVVALAGGKKSGKTFLLRADMDALPMEEKTGLPFAATNGWCHSCGHDLHTAMLLGAAALLKEMEDELQGTVKLMFQPAEEKLTGARDMVAAGLLENPKVDAAFGMHVGADQPIGVFGYNTTYQYASSDSFQIDIQGKGAHGAMPHLGVDPINVACHIHIALQEIVAREVSAYETLVVTVGQVAAGNAVNIIPDTARMLGTIRAYNASVRELAVRRVVEISENVAKAFGATAVTTYTGSAPSMLCDKNVVELMLRLLKGADMEGAQFNERKTMGSEDFAFVSDKVPSAFLSLGAANKDPGKRVGFHNPTIEFDEDAMPFGAAIYAAMAKHWLAENS